MIKILNVVGARPNFMKMAPILASIARRSSEINHLLVHTGQHYDAAMSDSFFSDLEMPAPDINLGVGSGSHAMQTARVMLAFEPILLEYKPDWLVVVGDVNSTLACTLVSCKLGVKIAHVEAGLRSFDWTMPEEINRVLTDKASDLLLTPSADADLNLLNEGINPDKIVRVGNVMIDTLFKHKNAIDQSQIFVSLGLKKHDYIVLTLHRPSNVDDPKILSEIILAVAEISKSIPVVFPAHPRTLSRLKDFKINLPDSIKVVNPLGYKDFLGLWGNSRLVMTDSGGLQEETTALKIPCLTLRETTERPITITNGSNTLVGVNSKKIINSALKLIAGDSHPEFTLPELWDGKTSDRIIDSIFKYAHATEL